MFRIRVDSYSNILSAVENAEFTRILSNSDLTKSKRFHFKEDRERFIAARIMFLDLLNDINGEQSLMDTLVDQPTLNSNTYPNKYLYHIKHLLPLTFSYNTFGKPEHDEIPFQFNWSHSGDLIAVTIGTLPVGIDVEQYTSRPLFDYKSLCTIDELKWIQSQVDHHIFDEKQAFLIIWSAKEAVLKAIGTGLSTDPRNVSINFNKHDDHSWSCQLNDRVLYGVYSRLLYNQNSYAVAWCSPESILVDEAKSYISIIQ